MEDAPSTIDSLPIDVLQSVLSKLSFEEKCLRAPLVCRRWHLALAQPSQAWHSIVVHPRKLQLDLESAGGSAAAWFNRCALTHELTLMADGPPPRGLQAFLAAALPPMAPSLRALHLLGCSVPCAALRALAPCTALRSLRVMWLVAEDHSSDFPLTARLSAGEGASSSRRRYIDMALEPLWGLTRLTQLEVRCRGDVAPAPCPPWLPALVALRRLELPCLTQIPDEVSSLVDLQSLALPRYAGRAFPDALTGLTALSRLLVDAAASRWALPLPAGVAALAALRCLSLSQCSEVQRVSVLTALTSLDLRQCAPPGWPAWVASLPGLRTLSLRCTPVSALPASVGALGQLEELRLEGFCSAPAGEWEPLTLPLELTLLSSLRRLTLSNKHLDLVPLRLALGRPGHVAHLVSTARHTLDWTLGDHAGADECDAAQRGVGWLNMRVRLVG